MINSLNTAAVDLEKAGSLAKDEKDFPLAVELYKARFYPSHSIIMIKTNHIL
jgi:hypothetical protein